LKALSFPLERFTLSILIIKAELPGVSTAKKTKPIGVVFVTAGP
jgi:hypothetical protein